MTSCPDYQSILVLSLRDLQLTSVFKHLTRLVNLQILFLSGNRIMNSDIERYLNRLKSLRKLDLSQNALTCLPREDGYFSRMSQLEFLVFSDNQVEYVEQIKGLSEAPALTYLSLEGNPITEASGMYRYDIANLFPSLLALD